MPISVDELMIDPDFATRVDIVRTTHSVDNTGRLVTFETTLKSQLAIVQAGSGQRLVLLDDGSRISDSIVVFSPVILVAAGPDGQLADIILWNGQRYLVKSVATWLLWGAGYVRADCEFIGINP